MSERQKNSESDAASRCPLCAADNRCAMAAGAPAESCWCYTASFSPAALPAGTDATRCLCPDCAGVTESA